ncbi:MAG: SH3 domain-containing protein [Thermoguttaceae bacterium]
MRLPLAALACSLLCAAAATAAAAPNFPYTAYVTAENVYVRSGPGDNYYPTEKLKAGDKVEVYRHDPGGWLAIRPVPGSFSWVAGRYLQLGNKNIATVTEDRVAARVGSRFSDVRDCVQVRLHRGEAVEVLDAPRDNAAAGGGSSAWYKIASPAGEFRWISSRFVDTEFPSDGLRKNRGGAGGEPQILSSAQFEREVDRLELDLSTMVAEEPTVWRFGDLKARSDWLLSQASGAADRARARLLLDKVARFDDMKQRYDHINALHEEIDRADHQLAGTGPRPSGIAPQFDTEGRYDGVGKLTRVTSPRNGAPQYALVDREGRVRCYVTPGPGINLRYYLGREVGINGTRGYMPEQQASHLMAQHINVIDGTTLR